MRSVLSGQRGDARGVRAVLLIVFGILAPVLSWLFQLEPSASAVRNFAPILLFVCGLSFYFGGMAAAFKAPDRHRLHGTLVAPAAFVISPVVNLLVGKTPFPGIDSVGAGLLAAAFSRPRWPPPTSAPAAARPSRPTTRGSSVASGAARAAPRAICPAQIAPTAVSYRSSPSGVTLGFRRRSYSSGLPVPPVNTTAL
jgi:hypothetical protein